MALRMASVCTAIPAFIALIAGCQAPSKAREWHRRYMVASNEHDLHTLRAMTADDVVWRLGPWTFVGKEQVLLPHENDVACYPNVDPGVMRVLAAR